MIEVYAKTTSKVFIDPVDVIEKLIAIEMQAGDGDLIKKENKYFIEYFSNERFESNWMVEISKEKFDYISALKLVLKKIKKKS